MGNEEHNGRLRLGEKGSKSQGNSKGETQRNAKANAKNAEA